MQDVSDDGRTMLVALRTVVQSHSDVEHPGRLRRRLEDVLGPQESDRLRRLLHQVVAAAEENLPHDLRRITPLTSQALQRLSDDLAAARGWNPETASSTTQLWASALGFGDLAASSWPREPGVSYAQRPLGTSDATQLPPGARPDMLLGPPPAASGSAHWPAPRKSFAAAHSTTRAGEAALGAVLGYAGMSLPLCVAACVTLTVVLCVPVLFMGVTGLLLPILGMLGARVLMTRLGRGALVASRGGLEFTPYDASLRKPKPDGAFTAPWSQVEVRPGSVSVLGFAGRQVQVGPRNRAFVDAAIRQAEGVR